MEILQDGLDIYNPEPFGVLVCPECCGNIGNSCSGHGDSGCPTLTN